jgi:hypothetical protein
MPGRYPESERNQRNDPDAGATPASNYVATLEKDWVLSVVRNPNGSVTARMERQDRAYELTTIETTMLDLPAFGYTMNLSLDQHGAPCVVWSQEGGGSPFVWFCSVGVAAWSEPVMGNDYS